ncbi:MAG TPA: hypothetical protein VNN07_02065, partial [Candidatus Tectomicrobia bacterium]|nr:hypothetical protein [Candidatus Tectomicrobia bacterium]
GFTAGGLLDLRRQQWNRVHRQLKVIASSRARERPVFAFAHFLLPHDPWVFGPEGEYLPANVVERRSRTENYVNHLRFANRAILRLVDSLLADRRRPQPIIIVQADEGPFPLRYERDELNFDWRQATPEEVREKFGILNALYLPGVATERLSSSITPVNTFRLVFGSYFGADLPLLEDRIYVSAGNFAPYDFVDVTDIVMPPAKK